MRPAFLIFLSKHWDALFASCIACGFIYFFTRHSGIGISPDSVVYVSVAENISKHARFVDFNEWPLVDFPAGYPCFLALCSWLSGLPVLRVLPWVNGILFSAVMVLASIIISYHTKSSRLYKLLFLLLLACSPCLLEVYSMAWSETLFIFWILLFMIAARAYLRAQTVLTILLMGLVAALAFVTRYAGISVVITGGLLILLDGELTMAKKIKHALLFGITSISLATINLVHNMRITGNPTGVREKALRSFSDNIAQFCEVIGSWFPFMQGHGTLVIILSGLIFMAGICKLLYRSLQQQYFHTIETIIACFFIVYLLFMLTIASVSRFEDMSGRLLSPAYIPVLLIATSWIVPFYRKLTQAKKYILLAIAICFYSAWQYHHYQLNAEAWDGIKDAGIPGYTEDSWTQSPTVHFIRQNKAAFPGTVYSNANDAVYFLTGLHAMPLPHKELSLEKHVFLQHPSFYLIWFNDGENPDLVGLDFIKRHKQLQSVRSFGDGAIYFFSGDTAIRSNHP